MSHIRVLVFDIEQPDQACFDAIYKLISSNQLTQVTIAAPSPAPLLVEKPARAKPGPKTAETAPAPVDGQPNPVDLPQAHKCYRTLKAHGPLTTQELIEKSGVTPATVYCYLGSRRKGGSVVTKKDENGIMKNYLVR